MARRFIAFEIEAEVLHLAVSTLAEKGPQLVELRTIEFDPEAGPLETLRALREELQPGLADAVELLLPASQAYVRSLNYPFKSQRKLATVVSPDFAYRLPEASEHLVTDYIRYPGQEESSQVIVAAIPAAHIAEELGKFQAAELSLTGIGLLPWSLASGHEEREEPQLWAWWRHQELGLALFDGQRIAASTVRAHPEEEPSQQAEWLLHQAETLERRDGWQGLPMRLFGGTAEVRRALELAGRKILTISLESPGSADQSRVAQLALEGVRSRRKQRHNFLRGEFSPTGGWQSLRKPLRKTVALAAGFILIAAGAMWSGYQRQLHETAQLEAQAEQMLRQSFPEIRTLRDPGPQLESQLQQLRKQAGSTAQDALSPLRLLRAMSQALPDGVEVNLQEWALSSGEIRMEGRVDSFEAVDRLAESFNRIPGVSQAVVAESKLGSDDQVVFRMRLVLGGSS
ncbi:MAG: hypothetical protein C0624_00380 [Desulfuromonas sp.]|nr:MAG: hypothetical protein C0624_00380 [Desulfuromonas sp.]